MYDRSRGIRPDVVIVAPADNWKDAVRGLSLCGRPSNNFLLLVDLKKFGDKEIELLINWPPKDWNSRGMFYTLYP